VKQEKIRDPVGFAVRPAIGGDAPHIARVHVESWQSAYRSIIPESILDGLSVERRADYWSQRLQEPGETRTWIGAIDDAIVGFAGTGMPADPELAPRTAELESIYLLPQVLGLGLGRLLLQTATMDLIERGFSSAILWVFTENDRARQFYEAAGWRPDGTSETLDFNGTGIGAVRYRIDLAGTPPTPV
jgi:GNAT superfamily N-acetyltransferase